MAVIGKQFADYGLGSVLTESGIVDASGVNSVLSGKHYNRALQCHKVVMEALFCLLWQAFEKWTDGNAYKLPNLDASTVLSALNQVRKLRIRQSLSQFIVIPAFGIALKALAKFAEQLKSPLLKLWISYIVMVHLLLQFLRSTRA